MTGDRGYCSCASSVVVRESLGHADAAATTVLYVWVVSCPPVMIYNYCFLYALPCPTHSLTVHKCFLITTTTVGNLFTRVYLVTTRNALLVPIYQTYQQPRWIRVYID